MNTSLLNIIKQIVSQHGVETLNDGQKVKSLLEDFAAGELRPQKNALVACLDRGFAKMLQNIPANERGSTKTKLAERLNLDEGLDMALCSDTLDLLEAALFGGAGVSSGTDGDTGKGGDKNVRKGGSKGGRKAPDDDDDDEEEYDDDDYEDDDDEDDDDEDDDDDWDDDDFYDDDDDFDDDDDDFDDDDDDFDDDDD
jgi:hypothetical protein